MRFNRPAKHGSFFFFACPKEKEPKRKGPRGMRPPPADSLRVLAAAESLQTRSLRELKQCKLLFRQLLRCSARANGF
jgi:hypothetical protein